MCVQSNGSSMLACVRFTLFVVFCLLSSSVHADAAADFLDSLCLESFDKTSMPKAEAQRVCGCMRSDISPRLSSTQRSVLASAQADLKQGRRPDTQRFSSSGVRDLVIAAQARCEAAFYPPSKPLAFKSGDLQMTLRCNAETGGPEILIYLRGGQLLNKKERDDIVQRMMKGNFDSEYAKVNLRIDRQPSRTEPWGIDLTGQIVSSLKPYDLLAELRTASALGIAISRGSFHYSGQFDLANRIPARWAPCGGVAR